MAKYSSKWQHRVADSDEERFGLLDKPTMAKYKTQPIFQEPIGESPKSDLIAMGTTSGIGSMLVGARDLGFKVIGNAEWRDYYRYRANPESSSTFIENFPGAFMSRGLNDIPQDLMPGRIDFLAGHPECGRYSSLSHSVTKGAYKESRESDLSDLPLFLKMVAELRPRFFLMDDLPASFNPLPMSEYIKALPDYDLFPEWISNWGYGNIQKHRNRMFIVGALKSERFTFVPGERVHDLNLGDMIADFLLTEPGALPNHAVVDENEAVTRYVNMRYYGDRPTWGELKELMASPEGDRWKANLKYYTPEGEEKSRPGTSNPKWEGSCPVLSGGYNPLHPILHRPLSVRERARIQGFPDDFVFHHDPQGPFRKTWKPYGPDGQRGIKQTGKAMPLQFCTYVADQVKHHIEGVPFVSSGERVIKPQPLVSKAKLDFCELAGYQAQEAACQACWMKDTCHLRQEGFHASE